AVMFSIHPFAELLNDLRLRREGNFALCGARPGALPRGPRSLERLANFLVAASPRDALTFCLCAKQQFTAKIA
ncbi:MAG: hypothetical protein NC395_11825, partial [Prevotella sp.]|nr:hypothetical protein [Prevotella sp.]